MTLLPSLQTLPSPALLPGATVPIPAGVRPALADVAALLTARTYDDSGQELGTFTANTRPKSLQVGSLIDMAVADLASRLGADIPEQYWPEARWLASLQAAALVESSFFPREIGSDESAYKQYTAMFLAGVERLAARLQFPGALQGI